jgi:hypothetical protein
MVTLVKILTDDLGKNGDGKFHVLTNYGDTNRTLCTGEAVDGSTNVNPMFKEVKRGGITCDECLSIVRWFKQIKI